MTAKARSRAVDAVLGGLFFAILLPIPLPTPAQLPTPPIPNVLPTPSGQAFATPAASHNAGPQPSGAPDHAAASSNAMPAGEALHRVFPISFAAISEASPLDIALIGALMVLPLLLAMWLLVFGRTISRAARARDAYVRLMLAADLGLHPRDVESMSTKTLFALRDKAAFDELTGVLRAAAGIGAADREIARARRRRSSLAVAFIDVEGLKDVSDASGRAAGDALLVRLVDVLRRGLSAEDVLIRYGGHELVCVLPDTGLNQARARIDEVQLEAARTGVRFAAGVAEMQHGDDVVALFARADRALHELKAGPAQIVPLPLREGTA